jgi:GNAT superfamily N-acetyltransferase
VSACTIRLATTADLPSLVRLLKVLFEQEAEFKPDELAQARGLTLILENPEVGQILIAQQGADVAGMVGLLYTISTALGARVALLEDMVVAPAWRKAGIGSQLLEAAIAHARQTGCQRITLLTDDINTDAQRFYRRHGFTHSPMVPFRRLLN